MKTMITAHSGCDGTPDNSLEFLAHALQCGADALEVDVRVRADGTLYISHDAADTDCPDLDTVFHMMRSSNMKINCDLKEPEIELAVLSLASHYGLYDQLLFSGSVSTKVMMDNRDIQKRTLLNVKPIFPNLDSDDISVDERFTRLIQACRLCGAKIINVTYEMCTDDMLDRLADAGIGVSAWTVNCEDIASRLLKHNIFNITSRVPGMVLSLREKMK